MRNIKKFLEDRKQVKWKRSAQQLTERSPAPELIPGKAAS